MPAFLAKKIVSALPATLTANTIYFVRVGTGVDLFVTNDQGTVVPYPLNQKVARSILASETTTYRSIRDAVMYYANSYNPSGSLKITLPAITAGDNSTGSQTFVSMRFRLWEYGGRGTCWVTVDGYLQPSGSPAQNVWSNASAFIEAQNRSSKPIRVRLGYQNGRYVILIEKTTVGTDSSWLYPMVALESFHAANAGAASTVFDDPSAWTIGFDKDLTGYTNYTTITPATALLTSDVVTGVSDTTAGRLLTVGYMGWGSTLASINNSNIDDQTLNTGQWAVTKTIYSTFPVGFLSGVFENKVIGKATNPNTLTAYQTLSDLSNPALPRKWERSVYQGTIGKWQEVRNTSNLANVNEIKNGDLSVWAAGTAAPPTRFGVGPVSGSSNSPVSAQTPVGTSEAVPFGLKYWWQLSTYDGGFFLILPNVRRYAGRTMTFSFYAKASKAGASLAGLRFYQRMGTGGSPSSTVSSYGDLDNITLTTAVQRFVCTVTLPSIAGATLGTNDDSDLYISMNLALGGAVVSLTGFKMESGVAATPFEMRDEEDILMGFVPVSPAIQAALDLRAPKDKASFTGGVTSVADKSAFNAVGLASGTQTGFSLTLPAAAADRRQFEILSSTSENGRLTFRSINDAYSSAHEFMLAYRAPGTDHTMERVAFRAVNVIMGQSDQLNANYRAQVLGGVYATGPIRPGQYTLATLPSASAFTGAEIDVTDASGGAKRCRSDGTNWKILNTTTTVS